MNRTHRFAIHALCVGLVLATASLALAEGNKAVIELDKKAESNGEIALEFTPADGEPIKITISVMAKMKPQDVAKDVLKEFTLAIGEAYKVKMKDPHRVAVQGATKEDTFSIKLASNSVEGLMIRIK